VLTAVLAALILFGVSSAHAEPERVTQANYKQAFKYSSAYLKQFVYDTSVNPNWIGKTDSFWYSYRTSKGTNYYRVNPKLAAKAPLFDRVRLGMLLSEMIQKPLDATSLPLTRVEINDEGTKIKFVVADLQYEYELQAEKLTKLGKAPPAPAPGPGGRRGGRGGQVQSGNADEHDTDDEDQERELDQLEPQQTPPQQRRGGAGGRRGGGDYRNYAPDRKVYIFARKHNLYLVENDKENDAIQLTKDGVEDYSFGGTNNDTKARPLGQWSPDSKAFYATRADTRGTKELFLVSSLATPRPTLEKYRYPMPGEEAIRKTELHVFDRAAKKLSRVPPKWKDENYNNLHWGKAAGELRFVRRDRTLRRIELCALNVSTLESKCLISEGFENSHIDFQPIRYLEESDEMIWWSERNGWGHFYLCDREGKCKNAVTSGSFRASRIVDVDARNRVLYFEGNGREPGENVYYQHLYSVRLDGTGLTLIDPGDASHQTRLSPSRQFAVDNWSRVDQAPVSVLRDAHGRQVLELERADLSRLLEVGWKMPETFVVKAADGVTDLYGNMWKPFDFDPKKQYPIIANVYPGPQTEGVTHTFSAISTNQQLAQLGFIVIQVGHRGGAPGRSKAYASYGYFNLRDYGLADKKSAIEQLAARCPFIDIDRVGVFGHSGGGFMSAAAVLQKPYNEFFKAAVASAGNHDNNIYNNSWAERYHGLKEIIVKKDDSKKDEKKAEEKTGASDAQEDQDKKDDAQDASKQDEKKTDDGKVEKKEDQGTKEEKKEEKTQSPPDVKFEIHVPTNAELAANLKGRLLLVHGEMDNNVHPANTMRLVDALIKANKRFDMLIMPGKRHGFADYQPYFTHRMWDFFADHLLGDRQTGADILEKQNNHR
jgi:dipeptidyl aminopeptidase/acylaminoacyl peptidase